MQPHADENEADANLDAENGADHGLDADCDADAGLEDWRGALFEDRLAALLPKNPFPSVTWSEHTSLPPTSAHVCFLAMGVPGDFTFISYSQNGEFSGSLLEILVKTIHSF